MVDRVMVVSELVKQFETVFAQEVAYGDVNLKTLTTATAAVCGTLMAFGRMSAQQRAWAAPKQKA